VKVFDGTFLDYALKLDGAPRLYVGAKGINENLGDAKFIAQTVNYANNDGVLWCVLTNGTRVAVYKTNEPVAMDRKLLFELDLTDDSESFSDKAKLLHRYRALLRVTNSIGSASGCSRTDVFGGHLRSWPAILRSLCSAISWRGSVILKCRGVAPEKPRTDSRCTRACRRRNRGSCARWACEDPCWSTLAAEGSGVRPGSSSWE
jgi:hypothetical protein